jgi:hypothetical protein
VYVEEGADDRAALDGDRADAGAGRSTPSPARHRPQPTGVVVPAVSDAAAAGGGS